jgi:hypothetical protein
VTPKKGLNSVFSLVVDLGFSVVCHVGCDVSLMWFANCGGIALYLKSKLCNQFASCVNDEEHGMPW